MLTFSKKENARPIARIHDGKKTQILKISDTEKGSKALTFDRCEIIPNIFTREVLYIAGPSGSGKTTIAVKYLEEYKKIFPKNPIFVFSRLKHDPALDLKHLKIRRILIDQSLIDEPIDIETELFNCLVLFDDCNTIQDTKLKQTVSKVMNDILEVGRHQNIYTIITSHLINMNEKKDSRTILNECHAIIIFPKSGSAYQIKYALHHYFGLSNKQILGLLNLKSRWVMINKTAPQYILSEHLAAVL